ncbi:LD-carboxypeptidase [Massilia sp. IC2-278]|uniref:S66 peptidase family protein n=1 Tax=Massilia sp. IC2-278 TaxID=2887200 RepID=UPI001E57C45E|nr:LD-carboxypeptidase [Massilia sp. IC2-278]MCC2960176.1 LD-carboxypeptidase [Massilia sp. IC2-278]
MSSLKISRRAFAAWLAAAATLPLHSEAAARPRARKPPSRMKPLIKPPRLRRGDTVGLIAPGGYTSEKSIAKARANIESLGLKVREGQYLREVNGNYAGTVGQRLSDLHAMFADPEVTMLWPIRGGSGCISLLKELDYGLIRRHPKILLGYSDITALHLAILKETGLVTFHGPVASSTLSDYAREHMLAVLGNPQPTYTIPMALENSRRAVLQPHFGMRTVHGGSATGPLIGGNLSLVAALAGTPYAADFRDAILFLEEVNEAPYRIDRWMTQLDLAVGFRKAAALMIGICEDCGPEHEDVSLTLDQTFDIHLQPLAIPAVTGYSIGHIRNQFTIPMGIQATLDAERQTVTLLEPAVAWR